MCPCGEAEQTTQLILQDCMKKRMRLTSQWRSASLGTGLHEPLVAEGGDLADTEQSTQLILQDCMQESPVAEGGDLADARPHTR